MHPTDMAEHEAAHGAKSHTTHPVRHTGSNLFLKGFMFLPSGKFFLLSITMPAISPGHFPVNLGKLGGEGIAGAGSPICGTLWSPGEGQAQGRPSCRTPVTTLEWACSSLVTAGQLRAHGREASAPASSAQPGWGENLPRDARSSSPEQRDHVARLVVPLCPGSLASCTSTRREAPALPPLTAGELRNGDPCPGSYNVRGGSWKHVALSEHIPVLVHLHMENID